MLEQRLLRAFVNAGVLNDLVIVSIQLKLSADRAARLLPATLHEPVIWHRQNLRRVNTGAAG